MGSNKGQKEKGVAGSESLSSARRIAAVLVEKKIRNVWIVEVAGLCSYADCLVLGDAENERHMQAALEALDVALSRPGTGLVPERGGRWTLLDLGDVVVDLFLSPAREVYRLEDLYAEAPILTFDVSGRETLVRPEERLSLYPSLRVSSNAFHESSLTGN